MIIGLVGQLNSGKDTVAAHLIKEHGFERRAFADPLKRSVAALLDIPTQDIEKYKNNLNIRVELTEFEQTRHDSSQIIELSFREFLQRFGTESHRDVFGENFWVDQTLPDGFYFYNSRNIVITDVRFISEAKRIRSLNGHIVLIERPGLDNKDPHRSEEIDFETDITIKNDSNIDDLYVTVDSALKLLKVGVA